MLGKLVRRFFIFLSITFSPYLVIGKDVPIGKDSDIDQRMHNIRKKVKIQVQKKNKKDQLLDSELKQIIGIKDSKMTWANWGNWGNWGNWNNWNNWRNWNDWADWGNWGNY